MGSLLDMTAYTSLGKYSLSVSEIYRTFAKSKFVSRCYLYIVTSHMYVKLLLHMYIFIGKSKCIHLFYAIYQSQIIRNTHKIAQRPEKLFFLSSLSMKVYQIKTKVQNQKILAI